MFWQFGKKSRIYLDSAAGFSPNPSSAHEEGRGARKILDDARTKIARLTEVQADDVIFTSGATEANALAILGCLRHKLQTTNHKPHALYLPSAHASIVENMRLAAENGAEIEPLPIRDARVDIDALTKMIRPETALISMEAVCGETGTIWNTREVRTVLDQYVGPMNSHVKNERLTKSFISGKVLLHVDASQTPLTEKITRAHFGADLLVFDASKVGAVRGPSHCEYGGRGIGALIASPGIPLEPLYRGGGQERGLRPGSESPELARAFADALAAAAKDRETFRARALRLRTVFKGSIAGIPHCFVYEARAQAPHILNVSLPGRDTDYVAALMDEAGFAVSTRSACETDSAEGSRAVFVLTGSRERALATLRFSWGRDTTEREVRRAAEALKEAVRFVDPVVDFGDVPKGTNKVHRQNSLPD